MKRSIITLLQIPEQFRTVLQGSHNENVYMCKYCYRDLITQDMPLFNDSFKGFAELGDRLVIVYKCPECEEILYHHAEDIRINMFLEYRNCDKIDTSHQPQLLK